MTHVGFEMFHGFGHGSIKIILGLLSIDRHLRKQGLPHFGALLGVELLVLGHFDLDSGNVSLATRHLRQRYNVIGRS